MTQSEKMAFYTQFNQQEVSAQDGLEVNLGQARINPLYTNSVAQP